jgi:dolichol-phosphate mannosyltransferase
MTTSHYAPQLFSRAAPARIAVVIPCYQVKRHVLSVIAAIGPEVTTIYVVDDRCPDCSGDFVELHCTDPRVKILRNPVNLGVGGAVMHGYRQAVIDGMDVIVKIDGDGQMNPRLLSRFVEPILARQADYVKGNRFYDLSQIRQMPAIRLVGNAILSFMSKFSTGYWGLFDPTNGFTALSGAVAAHLPLSKISNRYFFETDMLFRLNTLRAVVIDMPMHASYGDEKSNLSVAKVLPEFLLKHARNFTKRIFYNYFLRDMSVASLELVVGTFLFIAGAVFGSWHWLKAVTTNVPTPLGTIMLAVLPILIGIQLLLAFLAYDIATVPTRPISDDLVRRNPYLEPSDTTVPSGSEPSSRGARDAGTATLVRDDAQGEEQAVGR